MKLLSTLLICFLTIGSYSQNLNLRKAILKSNLILTSHTYTTSTIRVNDFTKTSHVKINKIDLEIKNNLTKIPENLVIRTFQDNEDYYSEVFTADADVILKIKEEDISYYDIFFINKTEKEYQALLILKGLESKEYQNYVSQIKTISKIELIKNDQDRFDKTLDWFIKNGLTPDSDFVDYYKQEKIINDTIQYSEQQYVTALNLFKSGKEALLPIIKRKYFDEIKVYYIKKLQQLIDKNDLAYNDYYSFYKTSSIFTDNFNHDINSVNYILNHSLTTRKYDKYDKKRIMEYLLKTLKDWK